MKTAKIKVLGFCIAQVATASSALGSGDAEKPRIYLVCNGYSNVLGGTIVHEVVIYQKTADFDGSKLALDESQTTFTLTGPFSNGVVQIMINRLTGSYIMSKYPIEAGSRALDLSKLDGQGCEAVNRKF